MTTFLFAMAVVAVSMTALAIGYILRGKMMRGGCGAGRPQAEEPCDDCTCERSRDGKN